MEIRKYREKDIPAMISIWNKVVEDGETFPQEDFLNDTTGADFLRHKHIAALQTTMEKLWGFIFCIQTILVAVGILQMQVMLLIPITAASILVKN